MSARRRSRRSRRSRPRRPRRPRRAAGPGPYLSELDPTPGSGFGAVDGADEGERDDDARDRRGDWTTTIRSVSARSPTTRAPTTTPTRAGSTVRIRSTRETASGRVSRGCGRVGGRGGGRVPAATSSRVLPRFARRWSDTEPRRAANVSRRAGPGRRRRRRRWRRPRTRRRRWSDGAVRRGDGRGGRGDVGAAASSAAVDAVTALLDAAPELARVATIHARTVANTAPITAASARRIPRAAYAAVGACAPWAARLAEASSSSSSGFLAAALRASLEPLRRPDEYSDATIAAASGAIAAALNASRPSPAELLSSSETAEAARILPAAATARRGVASAAASECLGALGAAMLRRAPGGASTTPTRSLGAARRGVRDVRGGDDGRGEIRGGARLARLRGRDARDAALTVAAADAPPRRDAPPSPQPPARSSRSSRSSSRARKTPGCFAASFAAPTRAFAPAADACAFFVETTIRRAAAGDVDADVSSPSPRGFSRRRVERAPRASSRVPRGGDPHAAVVGGGVGAGARARDHRGSMGRRGRRGAARARPRARPPPPPTPPQPSPPPPSRPSFARRSPPCTSRRFVCVGPRSRRRCATLRRLRGRARRSCRRRRGWRSNAPAGC